MTNLPTQPGKYAFFRTDGSRADLFALAKDGVWLDALGNAVGPGKAYKFWFHLPADYLLHFERDKA